MDEVRVLKHLHEPLQILWFDTVEIGIIIIFYLLAILFEGFAYLLLLVGPYWFISEKRVSERGFASHIAYEFGLMRIKGYPDPSAKIFHE
jgi:hypothetical protein